MYQLPLEGTIPPSFTPPGFLDFWAVGGLDQRVGMYVGYEGELVVLLFPDRTLGLFPPHCLFPVLDALDDQDAYAEKWWHSGDWHRSALAETRRREVTMVICEAVPTSEGVHKQT